MKPQRFEFTADTMAHLRACRAQGLSKVAACAELGVSNTTVDRAAQRVGKLDALKKLFPHGGKPREIEVPPIQDGMRKLVPEQIMVPLDIDRSLPHVRAASMEWRVSA